MQPLKMWKPMRIKEILTKKQYKYKNAENVEATVRLWLFGGNWRGNRKGTQTDATKLAMFEIVRICLGYF